MKKTLTLLMLSAAFMTASAQQGESVRANSKFFDNWSIGLIGGGVTTLNPDYQFIKNTRGAFGLELTKMITPVFGMAIQGNASINTRSAGQAAVNSTAIDHTNVSLLAKWNLMNAFCGYKGTPRLFEIEAVIGAGWMHAYQNYIAPVATTYNTDGTVLKAGSPEYTDGNSFSTKAGLNFNFNVGKAKAWTIALKPAITYDMMGHYANGNADPTMDVKRMSAYAGETYPRYNLNRASFEMFAGVTYHFKNSNGTHSFASKTMYSQSTVDGLNGQINDLRGQVADKDGQLNTAGQKINQLQKDLNDCRNRKPTIQTRTVTENSKSLEQTITFAQGKTIIAPSQLPNVERIATFLSHNPKAKVDIKGYASPEGSAEINAKIAQARADAVKAILVKKYKVAADRVNATGAGVGNMFSENDWNRVSICTINEGK